MISLKESSSGVSFAVRVQPRASRTAISGVLGEGDNAALKISLTTPPVEGQANEALVRFFAELLNVPRSSVEIISGSQSRNKVVRIREMSAEQVRSRLRQSSG
ncbi:MAG TPA: DUF167 domain-containing protein [Pseudacidobacterium sp.]|nr:DUF167 domain-containing protein [Pseudacidobacterium sp.]